MDFFLLNYLLQNLGKFGSVILNDNTTKSFNLKTKLDGINGTNEQCLIYYYYLPNVTQNSITILKEEMNGENRTIDYVTGSPFNGWIERKVSFFAVESNYKVFIAFVERNIANVSKLYDYFRYSLMYKKYLAGSSLMQAWMKYRSIKTTVVRSCFYLKKLIH
jgi:hypothetical protein